MKIVLLGYRGMLGSQLAKVLAPSNAVHGFGRPSEGGDYFRTIANWKPDVVINAAGIVKQRTGVGATEFVETNSLLPHQLYAACRNVGARLIHFSSDCVFSGEGGAYTEEARPDPVDLYGRSKLLGEIQEDGALTLRTSIIGRSLNGKGHGLVDWFLNAEGIVKGYAHSYFSGLTTLELSRLVARILTQHPQMQGLWHVAGPAISKFDLLEKLALVYRTDHLIIRDTNSFVCNRVLRADKFNKAVGYEPPTWNTMLREMVEDWT